MAAVRRRIVSEDLDSSLLNQFDGMRLDNLSAWIEGQKLAYKDHKNLSIVVEYGDEYNELRLVGDRLESDKELNERLAEARKDRARNKANREKSRDAELKLYEKLKKKYG